MLEDLSKNISLRLPQSVSQALEAQAQTAGISLHEYARAGLADLAKRGLPPEKIDRTLIRRRGRRPDRLKGGLRNA